MPRLCGSLPACSAGPDEFGQGQNWILQGKAEASGSQALRPQALNLNLDVSPNSAGAEVGDIFRITFTRYVRRGKAPPLAKDGCVTSLDLARRPEALAAGSDTGSSWRYGSSSLGDAF